jgi:HEPN domain-containing protein
MTHSSVQLLTEVASLIPSLGDLIDDARELDLHYIPARYPNGLPGGFPHTFYGEKTAKEAMQCAARIMQQVFDFYRAQNFDIDE